MLNHQQEAEESRYSSFYKQPWVAEGVNRYLARKMHNATQGMQ